MSIINQPPFAIQEANRRGQDVYEVMFNQWGYVVDPAVPTYENMSYPALGQQAIPCSLAGIAIGPRSTVDRAWVSYNLQKEPVASVETPEDRLRRLSVDSPLYFTQAGKTGKAVYTDPLVPEGTYQQYHQGLLYVYAAARYYTVNAEPPQQQETTVLPTTYLNYAGVSSPFGFAAGSAFVAPKLHLYLFTKPGIIPAPPKRFPFQMMRANATPIVAGAKTLVGQIPIFGRKRVKVSIRSARAITLDTGLLRGINDNAGNTLALNWEADIKTDTAAAGLVAEVSYDDPCADYLLIYATITVADDTVKWVVTAYD